jgi:hypothetical protein
MLNLNFNIIGSKSFEQERGTGFNEFPVQILLIGGGGGGGGCLFNSRGSGGGAGGFISASWSMPPLTTFDVIVGDGGAAGVINQSPGSPTTGSNGGDTKLVVVSTSDVVFNAIGGGGGVALGEGNGQAGGSSAGGGLGAGVGGTPTPTIPSVIPFNATLAQRTGSLGGVAGDGVDPSAGGGGGVLTNGGSPSIQSPGTGLARSSTFVSAISTLPTVFAEGGVGATVNDIAAKATPIANSGFGGGGGNKTNIAESAAAPGASGVFAIRYAGLPKATGGVITQADGFTTHLFTSSSQLVVSGRTNSTP